MEALISHTNFVPTSRGWWRPASRDTLVFTDRPSFTGSKSCDEKRNMAAGRKRRKEAFPRGTGSKTRFFNDERHILYIYWLASSMGGYFFSSWESERKLLFFYSVHFSNHGILFPYLKSFPPPPFETHAKYAKAIGGSVEINVLQLWRKKKTGCAFKTKRKGKRGKEGGFREKSRIDKAERCLCIRNSFSKGEDACVGRKILNLSFLLT